ncbi:hypothetical protein ACFLWA_02390 [Chloroflexota bacterium]
MAELLQGSDWADSSSLGLQLLPFLSDEYIIVTDATVHGCRPDAVVVGPRGLYVLRATGSEDGLHLSRRSVSGRTLGRGSTWREARHVTKALRRFLRNEFPALRPNIHYLWVLDDPGAEPSFSKSKAQLAVGKDAVAETITLLDTRPGEDLLDPESRQAVAWALRDAILITPSRATTPFIFRSGGLFGSGKKVWTIQAAIRHMDKYPEDGYFHLRNGSIARWFADQGADQLSDLAQEVLRVPETDSYAVLEKFLAETGLVRRSPLVVRPKKVNLGCVLSGEGAAAIFRMRPGRRGGYSFGSLRATEPWLRVDPRAFSGQSAEATVSVDTTEMLVARKPWRAEVLIESGATGDTTAVPVRVRVTGMPSAVDRILLRPLIGLTYAGMIGAGLGWYLGGWAIPEPDWFPASAASFVTWTAAWTLFIGLFWALLGGIRGALQPLAWPTSYAISRWFLRTLVWGGVLTLLVVAGYWALGRLAPDEGPTGLSFTMGLVLLLAWSLAIVPAVLGETKSVPDLQSAQALVSSRLLLRPALVGVMGVVLALSLVVGVQALGPAWQAVDVGGAMSTAQGWLGERCAGLETGFNDTIDQFTLRYYDRRAPAQPTAIPVPEPVTGGVSP